MRLEKEIRAKKSRQYIEFLIRSWQSPEGLCAKQLFIV